MRHVSLESFIIPNQRLKSVECKTYKGAIFDSKGEELYKVTNYKAGDFKYILSTYTDGYRGWLTFALLSWLNRFSTKWTIPSSDNNDSSKLIRI